MQIEKGVGADFLMSDGEHVLEFTGVERKRVTSKFPDGKQDDGMADVFIWKFVSHTTTDGRGVPEEVDVLTDTKVTPNNNTSKLIRMIVPGWNFATDNFDPDTYKGRLFSSYVVHQTQASGKVKAVIAKLTLMPEGSVSSAEVDPFAN